MYIQIRNTGGKFLRKLNFFAKSFSKTETFRENHPGNNIFLLNLSLKRELFAKTIPGINFFRENFRENKNFCETKFREKLVNFRLFNAFRETEKRGFRFNPNDVLYTYLFSVMGH
jgi:hypothetical protein